jgi:hypothetical protein
MGAHIKKFIVVCLYDEWGFEFEPFSRLREIVENAKSNYWEFMNPGTILTYFIANRKNRIKVEKFLDTVRTLIKSDQELQKLCIGQSEGELVAETDFWGRIKSSPLGSASTEAMTNAKNNNLKNV